MSEQPVRILLVEDNPADIRLIEENLHESADYPYTLETVTMLEDAVQHVAQAGIDVVLLDLFLPDSKGPDTLVRLRDSAPWLPIVVLTRFDDKSGGLKSVQAGAQDFLVKGHSANHLLARSLLYAIERKRAEEALRESEARFRMTFEQAAVGLAHVNTDGRYVRINERLCDIIGYTREELLALTFQTITYPDDLDEDLANVDRLLRGDVSRYTLEKRYIHKNGQPVWVNLTVSLASDRLGQPQYFIMVVEDIGKRKRVEQAEREQRILAEALRDSAIALNSTLNLSEVLDRILANIERVVPHDAAEIMLIENNQAHIVRSRGYAESELADDLDTLHFPINKVSNLQYMIETRQPLIIPDIRAYQHWIETRISTTQRWRSYTGVPIHVKNEVIGFINLASVTPNFFTPVHADRLQAFAVEAAIAIHNAQLYEQAKELAVLEERQRLARDLHDSVSQALFSASIIAESLPRLWQRDATKALQHLEQLRLLNRSALAEMRSLLLELRPDHLLRLNLADQLRQLAQAMQGRKRMSMSLNIDDKHSVPPDVQLALYRIAQEALNNIIKHTRATSVAIDYISGVEQVELRIADNGKGFDLEHTPPGLGLDSMRERAAKIGAQLEFSTGAGQGTQVHVVWMRQHLD
ncbi:MAG: PAS domain S-box protein [Chloroflexi bacterium]|nr:PAS domain S-box protein [Chloroflexota bacterium]